MTASRASPPAAATNEPWSSGGTYGDSPVVPRIIGTRVAAAIAAKPPRTPAIVSLDHAPSFASRLRSAASTMGVIAEQPPEAR
ncbi:hypothetical protein AB0E82_00035 [Streptomyces anulatus]